MRPAPWGRKLSKTFSSVLRVCGFVEVFHDRAGPMEALTRGVLDALRVHSATREHGLVFRGEVFADYGDDANVGEVSLRPERNKWPRRPGTGRAVPGVSRCCRMQHCLRREWTWFSFCSWNCTCAAVNPTCCGLPRELLPAGEDGELQCRCTGAGALLRGIAATAARTALAALAEF